MLGNRIIMVEAQTVSRHSDEQITSLATSCVAVDLDLDYPNE